MTKDVKRTNEGTSMKDVNKKIPLKEFAVFGMETGVMKLNHMSQHHA